MLANTSEYAAIESEVFQSAAHLDHDSEDIEVAEKAHFEPVSVAGCRMALTLMFTDIVASTCLIERIGDQAWHQLLTRHDAVVRAQLRRYSGREVDSAGDGFFAVFDSASDAIRCAVTVRRALFSLGLQIRCGVHTSECWVAGRKVSGLAVHMAARIAASAAPDEILVSKAAKELAAEEGARFLEFRCEELRGLRGIHQLFPLAA